MKKKDWKARKINYDYGFKNGKPVYCGQDLKDFEGLRIAEVDCNETDTEVVVYLESDSGDIHFALYLDNMVLDGESIKILDSISDYADELVPLTESDMQALKNMELYYANETLDEDGEVNGTHFTYCNSKELEGEEEFITKGVYVFHDGKIMTERTFTQE